MCLHIGDSSSEYVPTLIITFLMSSIILIIVDLCICLYSMNLYLLSGIMKELLLAAYKQSYFIDLMETMRQRHFRTRIRVT